MMHGQRNIKLMEVVLSNKESSFIYILGHPMLTVCPKKGVEQNIYAPVSQRIEGEKKSNQTRPSSLTL